MHIGYGGHHFLLLALAADTLELAGAALARLWKEHSPGGRLANSLRALEANSCVEQRGAGPLDARLFRLTAAGRAAALGGVDAPALWNRHWDGLWRIAAFDIPEEHERVRARLRRRLRKLRFGWLQNSVWISPDPHPDLLNDLGGGPTVADSWTLLEARPAGGNDNAMVVAAWDFNLIARKHSHYRDILRQRPSARTASIAACLRWAGVEQRAWRTICSVDPFLPRALLPDNYGGLELWEVRLAALNDIGRVLRNAATT